MAKRGLTRPRRERLLALALYILKHPGIDRSELVDRFHIPERRLQSDLGVLRRNEISPRTGGILRLVWRDGYRYEIVAPRRIPEAEPRASRDLLRV